MESERAVGIAGAVILNTFVIGVLLALTLQAHGILAVLGFVAFSIKLILMGVKLYALLLR
jgi:hypothetical protein